MPGFVSYELPDELELPNEQRRDKAFILPNGSLLRFTPIGVDQELNTIVLPTNNRGKVLVDHISKTAVLIAVSTHPRDRYTDVIARQMRPRDLRDLPTRVDAYERLLQTFTPSEHLAQLTHDQEIVVQAEGANLGDAAIAITHQDFSSYN